MVESKLLTVLQVADGFQVTAQTIRNWLDQGLLPAVLVGRAYRIRQEDVGKLMDAALAGSESLATQRDPWVPGELRLSRGRGATDNRSIWDDKDEVPVLSSDGRLTSVVGLGLRLLRRWAERRDGAFGSRRSRCLRRCR